MGREDLFLRCCFLVMRGGDGMGGLRVRISYSKGYFWNLGLVLEDLWLFRLLLLCL